MKSENENFTLNGFTIHYGKTTVRELLAKDKGYAISDLAQITEEPTIATCNLNQDGKMVALLGFYEIKETITLEQLLDIPINILLPETNPRDINEQDGNHSPRSPRFHKIIWSLLVHLGAAALFLCIFLIPPLFTFIQNTTFNKKRGGGILLLIVLPSVIIAFIWGGEAIGPKGPVGKKILLSLWVVLNVAVTLAYLYLIGSAFSRW